MVAEFRRLEHVPPIWEASCRCCSKGCRGYGYCHGDALASLPCSSSARLSKAGLSLPDWKEALIRDERRRDLV